VGGRTLPPGGGLPFEDRGTVEIGGGDIANALSSRLAFAWNVPILAPIDRNCLALLECSAPKG
jgi:hypothetical protein